MSYRTNRREPDAPSAARRASHVSRREPVAARRPQSTRDARTYSRTKTASSGRKRIALALGAVCLLGCAGLAIGLSSLGFFEKNATPPSPASSSAPTFDTEISDSLTPEAQAGSGNAASSGQPGVNDPQIVMNLNGSQHTLVKQGQPYIESGCHAVDRKEGNLAKTLEIAGTVDTSTPGTYEITYHASNKKGGQHTKVRTVEVLASSDFVPNTKGVPVLMYHYVYTDTDQPSKLTSNYIKDTMLESQLAYLAEQDYYYPSYKELYAYVKGEIDLPERSIILTFDDARPNFLKYGIPLLEKYQIPATSFLIADEDKAKRNVKKYASEYISFQSHSYGMHKPGGTIGHGGLISAMSQDDIVADLKKAQPIVQNEEAFAYPFGDYTDTAVAAVRQTNILCSFTTEHGRVEKGDDLALLPRVRINGDMGLDGFIYSVS
ncbi:MAG: DUF5011 domain-containing protein [Coriobacteriia bacterium]|nr:DUF5011 domain-containing protein [Coriobacteriia bacterium]